MTMQLVLENVEGWIRGTNLYRDGNGQNFIISAPPFPGVRASIYLAAVEYYPVTDWASVAPEDPEQRRGRVGVDAILRPVAVDADDNPLNGLTPLHVLPAGTSHAEACEWLSSQREES